MHVYVIYIFEENWSKTWSVLITCSCIPAGIFIYERSRDPTDKKEFLLTVVSISYSRPKGKNILDFHVGWKSSLTSYPQKKILENIQLIFREFRWPEVMAFTQHFEWLCGLWILAIGKMVKREKYLNLSYKVGLYIEIYYHSISWRGDLKSGHASPLSFSSLTTRQSTLKRECQRGKRETETVKMKVESFRERIIKKGEV